MALHARTHARMNARMHAHNSMHTTARTAAFIVQEHVWRVCARFRSRQPVERFICNEQVRALPFFGIDPPTPMSYLARLMHGAANHVIHLARWCLKSSAQLLASYF